MTYNILYGGGFSKGWCLEQRVRSGVNDILYRDTSDQIIQIILAADPDILVVNEACGFNNEVARDVAGKIGLKNIFIAVDHFNHTAPTGIYTREGFSIISKMSLNYSDGKTESDIFRGLQVEVQTPNGNILNIYGLHLNPFCVPDTYARYCQNKLDQLKWLINQIDNIEYVVIAGDMNFGSQSPAGDYLKQDGWTVLGYSTVHKWVLTAGLDATKEYNQMRIIDHAWIHKDSHLKFIRLSDDELQALKDLSPTFQSASDHNPNVFKVAIYP
jgi:hypothetical protein